MGARRDLSPGARNRAHDRRLPAEIRRRTEPGQDSNRYAVYSRTAHRALKRTPKVVAPAAQSLAWLVGERSSPRAASRHDGDGQAKAYPTQITRLRVPDTRRRRWLRGR